MSNELGAARGFATPNSGKQNGHTIKENGCNNGIDHSVGVELKVSRGSKVEVGDVWAVVHHQLPELTAGMKALMDGAMAVKPCSVGAVRTSHVDMVVLQNQLINLD